MFAQIGQGFKEVCNKFKGEAKSYLPNEFAEFLDCPMEGKSCDSAISDTRDSKSDHIIDMELSYTYQECGGNINTLLTLLL